MFCYIYYLLQWKFPKQTLKIFCDKMISFHGDINFFIRQLFIAKQPTNI